MKNYGDLAQWLPVFRWESLDWREHIEPVRLYRLAWRLPLPAILASVTKSSSPPASGLRSPKVKLIQTDFLGHFLDRSTSDEYQIDRLGPFDADRWFLPKPVKRLDMLTCQTVEFLD